MFPHCLTDSRAFDVAQAMQNSLNRHYRLFSDTNRAAKQRFEHADWHAQQRTQREPIAFYATRVDRAAERLQRDFDTAHPADDTWQQVKLHDISLLVEHHQPELAETFFNPVTTKILHHRYHRYCRNDFIAVRPAVSTEYIDPDEPSSLPLPPGAEGKLVIDAALFAGDNLAFVAARSRPTLTRWRSAISTSSAARPRSTATCKSPRPRGLSMRWSGTATRSRIWWRPLSLRAAGCG